MNFLISLVGLAAAIILVWCLEPTEDLTVKVVFSSMYAAISVLCLLDGLTKSSTSMRVEPIVVGFTSVSLGVLLIVFSGQSNLPGVGINIFMVLLSLFPLWVFFKTVREERGRLLLFAAVPAIISAWFYIISPVGWTRELFEYLLVPLPVLSYAAMAWGLIARQLLICANQHSKGLPWVHTMESIAMLWLFVPVIAFTMLAVNALGLGDIWVTVSGIVVGLVFSGTISEPVKKLIGDLRSVSSPRSRRRWVRKGVRVWRERRWD